MRSYVHTLRDGISITLNAAAIHVHIMNLQLDSNDVTSHTEHISLPTE